MYYAIVSFGGSFPGPSVYTNLQDARDAIIQAERDTVAGDGDFHCDLQVLARVRINEYKTKEAALNADISDTTDNSRGRRTPGFIRTVFVR